MVTDYNLDYMNIIILSGF